MYFQSIDFAIFLPLVFFTYWFIAKNSVKIQNIVIVIASYIFYGWWDYRFLSLLILSSLIDYLVSIKLEDCSQNKIRKRWLGLSLVSNLSLLVFFKYYNFFVDSFTDAFNFFGHKIDIQGLDIILPVGISFYTFQTISYTIDVYRRDMKPTNNLISFLAYVSFFPQLVAGPIERATHLLPQFYKIRIFSYEMAVAGSRQFIWGLVKKVLIADNCAYIANEAFNNYSAHSGSELLIGVVCFSFQIYCDFSGYSDMACGVSKIFGFNLMKNFSFPYFSRDVGEFWRRWHISLSTWFRDYVYIPLGGSKVSVTKQLRNTFIVFLLSGFWHGAKWTFIIWGLIHVLFYIPLLLSKKNRKNLDTVAEGYFFPGFKNIINILSTYLLVTFAWIFFRSESIEQAIAYVSGIFNHTLFQLPQLDSTSLISLTFLMLFIIFEWINRGEDYPLSEFHKKHSRFLTWSFYLFLLIVTTIFAGSPQEFIYFQF